MSEYGRRISYRRLRYHKTWLGKQPECLHLNKCPVAREIMTGDLSFMRNYRDVQFGRISGLPRNGGAKSYIPGCLGGSHGYINNISAAYLTTVATVWTFDANK
ncbi:hypothetical protein CCM_00139 [Cordyceps militaris CM01]|uniref:Uncharacterized protein n=1 Tax=Cordyceps militaris (strain CM01) TaxID=983644 RepID=G3J7L9_CORMM|nr:uncharacterized protein CCM_00139 [Cordyceps militaris CM01]EGX95485.1 hypothetical protein CCM_00139 [Cordyceps militaris CM01]